MGNAHMFADTMMQRMTPEGEVAHERKFAHELGWATVYIREIEKCWALFQADWGAFDDKWKNCPVDYAVDLASGAGVFPVAYEKHFRNKKTSGDYPRPLYIFASEYTNPQANRDSFKELKRGLDEILRQICKNDLGCTKEEWNDTCIPDANGNAIFAHTQRVKLQGLSRQEFNGRSGSVQGRDPENPSRAAILLENETHPMSFQQKNFVLAPKEGERVLTFNQAWDGVYKNIRALMILSENALQIDVCNLGCTSLVLRQKQLTDSSAIVTCTSLLTCCGHRMPGIWENVLETASLMLRVGGYLIQHDTVKHGEGFGDEKKMREVGERTGMDLVSISEPIINENEKMILVIWKKAGSVQEAQEELEYVWNMFPAPL